MTGLGADRFSLELSNSFGDVCTILKASGQSWLDIQMLNRMPDFVYLFICLLICLL